MCASTGNTSASAAAYAARVGSCAVLIPEGKIALGKLSQAAIHGAKVIQIGGTDDALTQVRRICEEHPIALVNFRQSLPYQGQKSRPSKSWMISGRPDFRRCRSETCGNITAY